MTAPSAAPLLESAMALHRAGDLAAAARQYEAVLAAEPRNFDALHLLGAIALQSGDPARAMHLLARAAEVHADAYPALHKLGRARLACGLVDEARQSFERAIALAPDFVPAREDLALLLYRQERFADSVPHFEAVARATPQSVSAHNNLASACWRLARYDDALASWTRALEIDPKHPDALLNSLEALERVGRPLEAIERAQALLALQPAQPYPHYRAGLLFHAQGLRDEALQAFADALARDAQFAEARWMLAIAQLRLAYGPGEDQGDDLARFDDAVAGLDAWFRGPRTSLADRALATRQPFYIAYHDADNLASLSRYGDLCARLMRECHGDVAVRPRPRAAGAPVRVALVSAYFCDQSVWTAFMRGWCTLFDRSRIELHLFHTGAIEDRETAVARAHAASFTRGLASVHDWIGALRECAPDVIVYPDVCMDSMSLRLASLRIAPVQVSTWGHPQTTGLPTVDYFLSAEAFEPAGAEAHYRERLVLLPGIGCYYEELASAPAPGAREPAAQGPRFACVGTPYKYLPQHDDLLAEIAQRVGPCQFAFFVDMAPLLSRKVEERLALAFARRGLDSGQFVRFLPRLTRPGFHAFLRGCDVYLDSIGFSGFNTAMQAVECNLPIVTCEGRFMRGRFASGILRRIGLTDLVANDSAQYVDAAARLASDASWREAARAQIAERGPALFRDVAPVRMLEDFLVSVGMAQ